MATTTKPAPTQRRTKKPAGFTIPVQAFAGALGKLRLVTCDDTGALGVLSEIRAHVTKTRAVFTATDLEQTLVLTVPVTDGHPGDFMVPAKPVFELLKTLSADATMTVVASDGAVKLKSDDFDAELVTKPLDDFPAKLAPIDGSPVVVDAIEFRGAIKRTVSVASSDGARVVLTGVLLVDHDGHLRMVATDSYRLSIAETTTPWTAPSVLVPSSALDHLNRIMGVDDAEITVTIGAHSIEFKAGAAVLTTRLINGEYPHYDKLVPTQFELCATVSRQALLDAAARAKTIGGSDSPRIRLHIAKAGIQPSVRADAGNAEEVIEATTIVEATGKAITKQELTIAFNPDYLIGGLKLFEADQVGLRINDEILPALMTSTSTESVYLLMPVRVP